MHKLWFRGPVLLLLTLIAATGCRPEPEPITAAPAEPVAAVKALAAALQEGDLRRYVELSLPAELRNQQEALWRLRMQQDVPFDPAEAERYRQLMQRLTAPDAEAALWATIEPRLADLSQQAGPQWSLGVAMMAGFARAAVAAHPTMSEAGQAHAAGLIQAIEGWAAKPGLLVDPDRARQAIAIVVDTARALELPTLEQAGQLEYSALLDRGSIALRGIKDLARAYGIEVDAALQQVEAEVVALEAERAVLRVRYPLLGTQVVFEQPMLRIDGGWYREDAVQSLQLRLAAAASLAAGQAATGAEQAPALADPAVPAGAATRP